jgi:hypothetical protein
MRYHDRLIFWVLGAVLVLLAAAVLLAQSATYPAGVVSFTTKTAGQTIQSAHVNTIQAEITAIENALLNGLAHVVKPLTDATYDLGTGAFRWRDAFFSRNVTIGGTLAVTGTLTAPALIGGWTVVTSTSTGTLNDFAPGLVGNTVVRMNNATLATITGFAGGADGQQLVVESVGAGEVDLPYATSAAGLGSAAANRLFNVATSGLTPLAPGVGIAAYVYDGTATRWRLVAHEQGAFITPTFAAGVYTASGSMTWTVDSGDELTHAYYLKGRSLLVAFDLNATTVGGTLSTELRIALPNGYTVSKRVWGNLARYSDSGGAATSIGILFDNATAFVSCFKDATQATNWTAATNTTVVEGTFQVEIQD